MKLQLYFLDFDGVFCPNLLKSLNTSHISQEDFAKEVQKYTELNQILIQNLQFLSHSLTNVRFYIFTGRKVSLLKDWTENLLKKYGILVLFSEILYYPEALGYNPSDYYNWKLKILLKFKKQFKNADFHIFDDDQKLLGFLHQKLQSLTSINLIYYEYFENGTIMIQKNF